MIIGAGPAGARAAEALRSNGFSEPITIIGEEPDLPYARPPLSKGVLIGQRDISSTVLFPAAFYSDHGICVLTATRVVRLNPRRRTVQLLDRSELEYAQLILATGSRVRTLPFAPIGRPGVYYLRTLEDARTFASALRAASRLVVIGGGVLGLEVAASARNLGLVTTVVDVALNVMDRVMPPKVASYIHAKHVLHGVNFRLGTSVVAIAGEERLERVWLSDGSSIEADIVLVAIGVVPNVELAQEAGIAIDNGIVVDDRGTTSLPGIFAVGEVTNHPNPILGRRIRLESWQDAQNHAIAVASGIAGNRVAYAELPWFWSDQYDWNIQMVGAPTLGSGLLVRGDVSSNRFVCFFLHENTIVGAIAVNSGRDMRFIRRAIVSGAQYDHSRLSDLSRSLHDLFA